VDLSTFLLESERLRLLLLQDSFAAAIFQEFTDAITEFMGPVTPASIADVLSFIEEARGKMTRGEDIDAAILLPGSDEFLGIVALHGVNTATPEFGVWIKKTAQGKHYGREAIHALARWALANLTVSCLSYPVDRRNIASRTIPESLGGRIEREYKWTKASGKVLDLVEYRIYPESLKADR
jgi:RimJ/RimL family protein N-acetyltransferase